MPQLSEFSDERFPTDIAFGASGGPQRRTEIITLASGKEKRNQRWAASRRNYDAGFGIKDLDALHRVVEFFEARRGALIAFRFRDPLDWKSCAPLSIPSDQDQLIGTGDGETSMFPLIKSYGDGADSYARRISKPVPGSIAIAVDGTAQTESVDFNVDSTTGMVTFNSASIPAAATSVTAGFEFDVPVRFAFDELSISLEAFSAGDVPSINLIEVLI